MIIICDTSLMDFKAWSGGKDTLDGMSLEDCQALEGHLMEMYPDGISDEELNDFLWFEREQIAEILGYRNYEAMTNSDCDNWEEHYKDLLLTEYCNYDYEDYLDDWISDESEEDMSDEDVIKKFDAYLKERLDEEDEE